MCNKSEGKMCWVKNKAGKDIGGIFSIIKGDQ